jgi:hypothetical protein
MSTTEYFCGGIVGKPPRDILRVLIKSGEITSKPI